MSKIFCFFCIIFIFNCAPYKKECDETEKHLKDLNCISKDKSYTKKGLSFSDFCQETQTSGIILNTNCLSKIKSCDEIDKCTNSVK